MIVAAWRTLDGEEREQVWQQIGEMRLRELAGDESEGERLMRSLRRVVSELNGEALTIAAYKRVQEAATAAGERIEPPHRQIQHFGSWRMVKEAVALSEVTTVRRIEARYASRRLDKVWRYDEQTLRSTLTRCCEEYGRPVTVAELEFWREREIEKARALGDPNPHIPSSSPYRKRWGYWEATLIALGFTAEQTSARFGDR